MGEVNRLWIFVINRRLIVLALTKYFYFVEEYVEGIEGLHITWSNWEGIDTGLSSRKKGEEANEKNKDSFVKEQVTWICIMLQCDSLIWSKESGICPLNSSHHSLIDRKILSWWWLRMSLQNTYKCASKLLTLSKIRK